MLKLSKVMQGTIKAEGLRLVVAVWTLESSGPNTASLCKEVQRSTSIDGDLQKGINPSSV